MNAETIEAETGKEVETGTIEEGEIEDPEAITVPETMISLVNDVNTSPKTERENLNLNLNKEEKAVLTLSPKRENSEKRKFESWKMMGSLLWVSPSLRLRIQRR